MRHIFHRLRQDSIDKELFDIISGFEALFLEAVIKKQEAAVKARKVEALKRNCGD